MQAELLLSGERRGFTDFDHCQEALFEWQGAVWVHPGYPITGRRAKVVDSPRAREFVGDEWVYPISLTIVNEISG